MSVRDMHQLACPLCGSDEFLLVSIEQWVLFTPDGSEADDDAHVWDHSSRCRCKNCGHADDVSAFSLREFTVELQVQGLYAMPVLAHSPRHARDFAVESFHQNRHDDIQFDENVCIGDVEEGWS
jgi:hypothetical protein